ncbi:MAG: carbohydrate kinase [Aureibaculum sp.]|nr:carbohydrate kinase [Aureibaculum sp.]
MPKVTCFGEVLWDIFPTHKKIGGAPLNVALRIQSFDIQTNIISRVGDDDDGKRSLDYIKENGIDISTIQVDKNHKTGCVNVTLDSTGSASYEIEHPVAWDKIEISEKIIEIVRSSDAFIFGSLVCRDEVSKGTLLKLLQYGNFKVFDVNLRPPFYSIELLIQLMNKVEFIKCNDDELHEICNVLGSKTTSIEGQVKFLSKNTHTKQICVTKGKDGAVLLYNDQYYSHKGYPIKVKDTVGAGDSFLATLISKLLKGSKPEDALDFACAVGALVAGKPGANPQIATSEILNFIKNNQRK